MCHNWYFLTEFRPTNASIWMFFASFGAGIDHCVAFHTDYDSNMTFELYQIVWLDSIYIILEVYCGCIRKIAVFFGIRALQ